MTDALLGSLLVGLMFLLLALGLEVSIALGLVGLLGIENHPGARPEALVSSAS